MLGRFLLCKFVSTDPCCTGLAGKIIRTGHSFSSPPIFNIMADERPIGRYARIIMDHWFKRTFGTESRKRLLKLFLQELIPEHDIDSITYAPQEHINPFPGMKDIRIDVECTDTDGTRFIVEMQVAPQKSFYDRAVFYSSFAIQQQLSAQKNDMSYFFPTVYFVGLMNFSFHTNTDQVLFRYSIREDNTHELMTPHLQYLFLELPNCRKALTEKATVLDNFCYALHNMESLTDRPAELKQEIFALLFDSAEIANFTAEEKTKYEQDMTTERDIQNYINYAREQGEEKGRAEGRAEGKQEAFLEIVKRMADLQMKPSLIVAATGLSEEEVSQLLL